MAYLLTSSYYIQLIPQHLNLVNFSFIFAVSFAFLGIKRDVEINQRMVERQKLAGTLPLTSTFNILQYPQRTPRENLDKVGQASLS